MQLSNYTENITWLHVLSVVTLYIILYIATSGPFVKSAHIILYGQIATGWFPRLKLRDKIVLSSIIVGAWPIIPGLAFDLLQYTTNL